MQRANYLLHSLRGALSSARHRAVSQKELANILGIAEATMSRWMSGKIRLGQIELLLRFIERLPEERWCREIAEILGQEPGTHYKRKRRRVQSLTQQMEGNSPPRKKHKHRWADRLA